MSGSETPGRSDGRGTAADYLRLNRTKYTKQALDRTLRSAGYADAEIEAAWEALASQDRAAGLTDRRGTAAVVLIGAYAGVWLLYVLAFSTVPRLEMDFREIAFLVFAIVLAVPLLIALAFVWRSRNLRAADGHMTLAALTAPLLILLALAGSCLATYPPR